jgi:two-component SAPR family response regulator
MLSENHELERLEELPLWHGTHNGMYIDGTDYDWLKDSTRKHLALRAKLKALVEEWEQESFRRGDAARIRKLLEDQ